jgi:two-component system nitrogen regulation response regulator NtrX
MNAPKAQSKLVLIVEDNEVTRESLATLLRRHGYSSRVAATVRQALEALRTEKPDLILLDMFLSGGGDDGWALLAKLRCNPDWRSIPFIIVTGMGVACDEWATSLGARAIIRKPINPNELVLKLKRYCP